MHRDLKPDNILIGDEGVDRIRVADYGHCNVFASTGKVVGTLAKGTVEYDGYLKLLSTLMFFNSC